MPGRTRTAQSGGPSHHYMSVINPGRLIIIRVPYPMPSPWRSAIVAPLTPLMQEQGLRAKDISSIEGLFPYPDEAGQWTDDDRQAAEKLDRAFSGDASVFGKFWLYDWTPNGYVLARAGS